MLIGLCGAAGCGKDTLAYEFVMHDAYEQYRMADPIKNMLMQFHIRLDTWEDREAKEKPIPWLGVSPRYMAQTLGTEWGREMIHPDIWVKLAQGRWAHLNAGGKGRLVISDIRFDNEAKWLRDAGGILIKIQRPELLKMDNDTHRSETGVDERLIDNVVINDGTKDDLRRRAWEAIHVCIQ
jgi:hypothetical protein